MSYFEALIGAVMEKTRVSSKGQVVIPKSVRDELGLLPGAVLAAEAQDGAVVLRPVKNVKRLPTQDELARVAGCLYRPGPYPTLAEEREAVDEMFRNDWRDQ